MQDFFRRQHSVRIAGWSGKTRREPGDVARADRAGMIGQDVRVRTSPSSTVMPATSTSAAAVQVLDFKSSRPLVRCGCLGCDSCSSGHRFHYSFLQVRPRARHICCSANTSPCRVERTSTNKSVRPAGRKIKKGQRPALSLGRLRWIPVAGSGFPAVAVVPLHQMHSIRQVGRAHIRPVPFHALAFAHAQRHAT